MNATSKDIKTAIISLDQNFGTINFIPNSTNIVGIDIRSYTIKALSELQNYGINSILFVNEALVNGINSQNIKQFLANIQEVIVYKDLQNTFSSFLRESKLKAEEIIFISEDRTLRGIAANYGFMIASHPSIALLLLTNHSLFFVRITGKQKQFDLFDNIIPYYVRHLENDQIMVLAVMTHEDISKSIANRLEIDVLSLNLSIEDPMFVSIDHIDEHTPEKLRNQKILFFDGKKMLVALEPSKTNDSVPFHDMHGHFLFLTPNPTLLRPILKPFNFLRESEINLAKWPLDKIKLERINYDPISLQLNTQLMPIDSGYIKTTIDRYTGISDLDGNGKIKSRHCEHPENSKVISALLNDLRSMGYIPFTHPFTYNSLVLSNVIADLPGIGYFKAEPNLPEQIRQIFLKYPSLDPSEPWIEEISLLTGIDWMKKQNLDSLSPSNLRRELEDIFLKESSWWTKDEPLNGLGSQMIIVCCHLDSTAGREPPGQYNQRIDPAPGVDDNGSGLAAVLSIAKYLSQFRGRLLHTVRFCFFNAEEVGLKGSRAYAPIMKDKNIPIKAVINIDMMGYNNDKHKTFEIHAGYYDPNIRDLCLPIAEVIKQWSDNQGKLGTAQIYKGTIVGGAHDFDRNKYDGAIERSDHFSFQQEGYPACHISEDFFANYPTESSSDPNPNYHRFTDKIIDISYASDIVNSAALAIKELAST
jgi:Peptidase family M28